MAATSGLWWGFERYKDFVIDGLDLLSFCLLTPQVVRFLQPAAKAFASPVVGVVYACVWITLFGVYAIHVVPKLVSIFVNGLDPIPSGNLVVIFIAILPEFLLFAFMLMLIFVLFKKETWGQAVGWLSRNVFLFGIILFLISRAVAFVMATHDVLVHS
jgi:hypothetical protein